MNGQLKKISTLSLIFLALAACAMGCVEYSNASDKQTANTTIEQPPDEIQPDFSGTGGMDLILEQLENEGYNISEIRAAIENGDRETARSLMEQYMVSAP